MTAVHTISLATALIMVGYTHIPMTPWLLLFCVCVCAGSSICFSCLSFLLILFLVYLTAAILLSPEIPVFLLPLCTSVLLTGALACAYRCFPF